MTGTVEGEEQQQFLIGNKDIKALVFSAINW